MIEPARPSRGGHMYLTSEPLLNYAQFTQNKDKAKRIHHAKKNFTLFIIIDVMKFSRFFAR